MLNFYGSFFYININIETISAVIILTRSIMSVCFLLLLLFFCVYYCNVMSVWSGQDVSFLFFVWADFFLLFVLLLWAASIVEPMAFLVACHLTNKYACLLLRKEHADFFDLIVCYARIMLYCMMLYVVWYSNMLLLRLRLRFMTTFAHAK